MVGDTWRKMARKNITADDIDMQKQVFGDDSISIVLMILQLLVKCMVPEKEGKFDKKLASNFEESMLKAASAYHESMTNASKNNSEKNGIASLLDFIGLAPETKEFTIVEQSEPFNDAENLFRDLEVKDMKHFDPKSTSYKAVTELIRNRGKGKFNFVMKPQQIPNLISRLIISFTSYHRREAGSSRSL